MNPYHSLLTTLTTAAPTTPTSGSSGGIDSWLMDTVLLIASNATTDSTNSTGNATVEMLGGLPKAVMISVIVDSVSICLNFILAALLITSFFGNRSFIIFMPKESSRSRDHWFERLKGYLLCCFFSSEDRDNEDNHRHHPNHSQHNRNHKKKFRVNSKTLERYRTRAILNWTLFMACIYILIRIGAQILTIIGAFFNKPGQPSRYMTRVATFIHIFCHQYYQVLISLLIILWMRIALLWYKGTPEREKWFRVALYTIVILINIESSLALFSGAMSVMIGKEHMASPRYWHIFWNIIAALGFAIGTILITLVAVGLGIRVIFMMYRSHQLNKQLNASSSTLPTTTTTTTVGDDKTMTSGGGVVVVGSANPSQNNNRQKMVIIKSTCAMILLLLAVNLRTAGLLVIYFNKPQYMWTILTRGAADFFGISAIVVIYWPFRIASCWEPIINMRQYNTDTSEATELEPSAMEELQEESNQLQRHNSMTPRTTPRTQTNDAQARVFNQQVQQEESSLDASTNTASQANLLKSKPHLTVDVVHYDSSLAIGNGSEGTPTLRNDEDVFPATPMTSQAEQQQQQVQETEEQNE